MVAALGDIRRMRATRHTNYRGARPIGPSMPTTQRGLQMRRKKLKRALAGSSSLLALSIALPAAGQSPSNGATGPEELEEIVVTGLRGSLQRNLDMKREAAGVVDVITSEDIGKFPDSNVAASLQRVPACRSSAPETRRAHGHHGARLRWRLQRDTVGRPPHFNRDRQPSVDFSTVGADFVGALPVMKTRM